MPVVQLIPIRFKRHLLEQSGADGITIHLREDRRHITDRDAMLDQPNGSNKIKFRNGGNRRDD